MESSTEVLNIMISLYNSIEYNESMTGEKLNDIALQYANRQDYDNMKICFSMAIEKNYTTAMIHLGKYYEKIEINVGEMIRLYELAIYYNDEIGVIALVDYYKLKNDTQNILKYLNIYVDKFNDKQSIHDLIIYYHSTNDEENSMKYSNKLFEIDQLQGHFYKGKTYEVFKKYSDMKLHYDYFLANIDSEIINNSSMIKKQSLHIIKLYLDNDINILLIQATLHKINFSHSDILGHVQYKLNKIKLKDPVYSKIGSCNICMNDDIQLQLFDCLGHYYCLDCTINIAKCAICKCTKKHI